MAKRRRRIIVSSILITAALSGAFLFSKSRTTQLFGEIVARVETDKPLVALTFDDGPSARFTPEVLAILKERGVTGTFFLTGKETEENPQQARAIVEAGHEIGNHSYSHANMTLMGMDTVADEIERTDAAIRAAGYAADIHFRPPYGKKLVTLPLYLSRHGRKTIMWDIEPETFDDITRDADTLANYVVDTAQNGSIIILHVMYRSREVSRAALPKIIDGLRQRGFTLVTASRLMGSG